MPEDNPVTPVVGDNQGTQPVVPAGPAAPAAPPPAPVVAEPVEFKWKEQLGPDIANAPTLQKFPDTKDGLVESTKAYLNLQQLLSHEKVPVPKGADDVEGWDMFKSAMGIPNEPEGYQLKDVQIPENLKSMTFDKQRFSEYAAKHKLMPGQAEGLWEDYTKFAMDTYQNALRQQKEGMDKVVNEMRSEWGDAYDSNVELGQMVINKFSTDEGMQDFVTASLLKDPNGVRFLSKIGSQFAENKVGEFGYKRFALTPQQAEEELAAIRADASHPYMDPNAPAGAHEAAIQHVNSLEAIILKAKGQS